MVDQVGNDIPAAGVFRGQYVMNDEILYSTEGGFTQKGVTLAPGKGVLVAGTALARNTQTKLWEKWVSGGANGTGTPVGILRKTTDTGTDPAGRTYLANVIIAGILKLSKVSSANGGVSNLIAAGGNFAGAAADTVFGSFKF